MKGCFGFLIVLMLAGCQDSGPSSDFTGNEITYELTAGSTYDVSGTISFKERIDGSTTVAILLNGTAGEDKHPVHLHRGTLQTPKADVAALLSPVFASTGRSETILAILADESLVKYKDLVALEACVKIHLSDTGTGRDIILAGGNIGAAYLNCLSSGRQNGFSICKSE